MDALGYLDTVNHITLHELHDKNKFNDANFYQQLTTNFVGIYTAMLTGTGKNLDNDSIIRMINQIKTKYAEKPDILNRELYQYIKEQVEKDFDSPAAFALSRAVEYQEGNLKPADLFKEVYQETFQRGSKLSQSKITGERYVSSSALNEALKGKNLLELYSDQEKPDSRTTVIFNSLNNLAGFQEAYDEAHGKEIAPAKIPKR